ncbi:MAG TPA: hypothetical protein VLM91_17340 [Candidatus Methylomirabilis sp.]|nr:hypothetical protein [Candidatus Methylomirabilis sp.]
MEMLIEFSERLLYCRDPVNGNWDMKQMRGKDSQGPLMITASREMLKLQEDTGSS